MTAATSPRGNAPATTNRRTVALHEIARYVPIFGWLPSYSRQWLRGDVIAGVTLVALVALAVLGKVPGQHAYASVEQHPKYVTMSGLLNVRMDAPLFVANDAPARRGIHALIRQASPPPHVMLLDLEASSVLDTSSADVLAELADELKAMGIVRALARVRAPVRTVLERTGQTDTRGKDRMYASVEAGVEASQA